jgi:RNA polymerase sigma-70 factor (ECF subfamily)
MYYTIDMKDSSDRDLVLDTRRGEVEAFGELIQRYQKTVFNVCYRMLGERREAEDLTQETLIRAYKKIDTFDPSRPFGPWIRRVAANMCLNHLQRQKPDPIVLNEEWHGADSSRYATPEMLAERAESSQGIRAAILKLPAHYRAVIELRHYQELSYQEISEALGIPLSDVKSHLHRARRILAKRLGT